MGSVSSQGRTQTGGGEWPGEGTWEQIGAAQDKVREEGSSGASQATAPCT